MVLQKDGVGMSGCGRAPFVSEYRPLKKCGGHQPMNSVETTNGLY